MTISWASTRETGEYSGNGRVPGKRASTRETKKLPIRDVFPGQELFLLCAEGDLNPHPLYVD